MNTQQMMLCELVALRLTTAALARQILLRHGSEAFVEAEAQAAKFVETGVNEFGEWSPEMKERIAKIVGDMFQMADAA